MQSGPVSNKIIELCDTIANHDQFKEYRNAIINLVQNEDKYPEYFELLQYQKELEERQHGGDDISEEESEKLAELGAKAFSNSDVVKFMEAQDALEQLQDLVNNALSYVIDNGKAPKAEEINELEYNEHH